MPRLVLEAAKLPLLWYFAISGFACEWLLLAEPSTCGPYSAVSFALLSGSKAPLLALMRTAFCMGEELQAFCRSLDSPSSTLTQLTNSTFNRLCHSCTTVSPTAALHSCVLRPSAGVMGIFSLNSWMAIIIKNMLAGTVLVNSTSTGGTSSKHSLQATLLSAIPYLCAAIGMWWMANSSHRFREKDFHIGIPWVSCNTGPPDFWHAHAKARDILRDKQSWPCFNWLELRPFSCSAPQTCTLNPAAGHWRRLPRHL